MDQMKSLSQKYMMVAILILSPTGSLLAQQWEWQNPLPIADNVECIDFVDQHTGWFGCSAGTVVHTTDGGNTWDVQYTGMDRGYCEDIDFINAQEGWTTFREDVGLSSIFHTSDGGKTWTEQLALSQHEYFKEIMFVDSKHGWAGTTEGALYYTTDGGENWVKVSDNTISYGRLMTFVFFDTLNGLLGGSRQLHITADGGKTWKLHPNSPLYSSKIFFVDERHGWILSGRELWSTVDGGETWTKQSELEIGNIFRNLFFIDEKTGFATLGGRGVYLTRDSGVTWEFMFHDHSLNPYYFFTPMLGWVGLSRTTDGGKTLNHVARGFTLHTVSDVDFINREIGWVTGWNGNIYKTTDGGRTWRVQAQSDGGRLNGVFALDAQHVWVVGWGGAFSEQQMAVRHGFKIIIILGQVIPIGQ